MRFAIPGDGRSNVALQPVMGGGKQDPETVPAGGRGQFYSREHQRLDRDGNDE